MTENLTNAHTCYWLILDIQYKDIEVVTLLSKNESVSTYSQIESQYTSVWCHSEKCG